MLLSVIIPVYNEDFVIREVLERVIRAKLPDGYQKEIVIVDDGSYDSTAKQIEEIIHDAKELHPNVHIQLFSSLLNHGKGAALRAGFKLVTGDIVIIQDGDLEYSPNDYPTLLAPFSDPNVNVVYGTRFKNGYPAGMKFLNKVANWILALTASLVYRQQITDEATGYKVFRSKILQEICFNSRGFEFCPEFTGKVLRAGYRIHEVPISYNPRGILEGKKIRSRDGFIALWWLLKTRLQPLSAFMSTSQSSPSNFSTTRARESSSK